MKETKDSNPATPALSKAWERIIMYIMYALGLAGFLFGQYLLFSDQMGGAVKWMGTGLGVVFLTWCVKKYCLNWFFKTAAPALEKWANRFQPGASKKEPASHAPRIEPAGNGSPVEKPIRPEPPKVILSALAGKPFYLSRRVLTVVGIGLLAAAQPFLFLEKFSIAFLWLVPGLGMVIKALMMKEDKWRVVQDQAVFFRALLFGLPGASLIVAGGILLVFNVHAHFIGEVLGIAMNITGVFLLLSLFPKVLPDPLPDQKDPLEHSAPETLGAWNLWIKLGLLIFAAAAFYFTPKLYASNQYLSSLLLCLVAIGAVLITFPWNPKTAADPSRASSLNRLIKRIGCLLFLVLALWFAYQGQKLFLQEKFYPALIQYGVALLLLIFSMRSIPPMPDGAAIPARPLKWYWEVFGLLVILVLAAWIRTRLIDQIPFGVEGDEAAGTINAMDMRGKIDSITAHPVGAPFFLLVPRIITSTFFGIGNLGTRSDAIFYGIVGIFALFLLARTLWGPRIALGCAALMAFSRWHIHFSRFGFNNAYFITLVMLGFFFLIHGLRSRRKWDLVFSGMAFSFAVQTETAARLLPLILTAVLLFMALTQRLFFKRHWTMLLVFMLGVWMAGAQIYIFYAKAPKIFFNRIQEVSIYSQDPNAPHEAIRGFIDSTRASLGMMNFHGDYRERHNGGLSGEPVLDFWTSIYFALGLFISLYYWKRWKFAVILAWFFGFLSASAFSIEAPQSHRAFGLYPTLLLMIGAFLDQARRVLWSSLGKAGLVIGQIVFMLMLIPIGQINFKKYFDAKPAYDVHCTMSARYLGTLDPKTWEVFLMTAYFWQGHPPFMLYAGHMSGRFFYSACDVVPYHLEEVKNACFAQVFEFPPVMPSLQWFYPVGTYREQMHPKYGLLYQAWEVKAEEIQRTRGLNVEYGGTKGETVKRKEPTVNTAVDQAAWPLGNAGWRRAEGTIWVPHAGWYHFYLQSTDATEVTLGPRRLFSSGGEEVSFSAYLAGGLHRFRAHSALRTPGGKILFSWSGSTESAQPIYKCRHVVPFNKEPFPENYFFTYPEPAGLLEKYYSQPDWTGDAKIFRVQPALLVFLDGYKSAEWTGFLHIREAGAYTFELENSGFSEMRLNHQVVLWQGKHPKDEQAKAQKQPVELKPGTYPVSIRWSGQNGSVKWWWTPPGQKRALVPAGALTPLDE